MIGSLTEVKGLGKSLVIVESPAKAKTIGKFLGRNYIVKASMGHVRDLPRSQLGIDIEDDFKPKYITIRGKGPILKELREAAKKSSKVLLATDPDREGEAIAWHLTQVLNIDEQKCRIEFREITKDAVLQAIKNPRDIGQNLVDAQQARRILDRLVGYKLSPLLWAKVKKGLSAGRVQSVALRLIYDREVEITKFVPKEYWSIVAQLLTDQGDKFEAKLHSFNGKKIEINNEEQAKEVEKAIKNGQWEIASVTKKERRRNPAPPFTTSTLQQEAARKLNFSARKTMRIAQTLYEGLDVGDEGTVGLITYMRTDAVRIAEEASKEAQGVIRDTYGKEFLPSKPPVYKGRKGAQEAHEAIRPTSALRTPQVLKDSLTRDQYRLYKLIWERFIASQMKPAVLDTVSVDIRVNDYVFRATGSNIKFLGFMKVYVEGTDEKEEQDGVLPDLREGMVLKNDGISLNQHFTQPPPRYSEAMLVKTLEEKGIGRPSTYAPIIDTLLQRGYVALEEKRFVLTELGEVVIELLLEHFSDLFDVGFTATMESELDEVEEGNVTWEDVVEKFYDSFEKDLETAYQLLEKIEIEDEVSDVPCDKCGRMMVVKWGKFGKFLACPGYPECRNTKPLLNEIGVKCPKCEQGEVVERRSKKGRLFYGCSEYPDCDYVSWNRPVSEKCPSCGELLVVKKNNDQPICVNKECKLGGSS